MERTTNRDEWAAQAVLALRSVKIVPPSAADVKPAPPIGTTPHPPMTAREWLRFRDQRELDIAYTQSVAAEIRLRWMLKGEKRCHG